MPEQNTEGVKANLAEFLNRIVTVISKDGRKFKGKLINYDEHMNLLLEKVEEDDKIQHKLLILKGGNISSIST